MQRYQIYLDPDNVAVLDEMAEDAEVSRSQIIRDAAEAVASRYVELTTALSKPKVGKNPLLDLIGIAKGKKKNRGPVKDHDTIYFVD